MPALKIVETLSNIALQQLGSTYAVAGLARFQYQNSHHASKKIHWI